MGALDNPELNDEHLSLLLRNPSVTPAILLRVGCDRRFGRANEVKRALVRHPKVPVSLARSVLPHLYWRDLAELADDPKVVPGVRHRAEEVLKKHVEAMALGEKVSLARRATRRVIATLIESDQAPVLHALLGNGRLVEADALSLASSAEIPREVLASIADHPAWGRRYEVRWSLVSNPRTPVAAALRLVATLSKEDLERLVRDQKVPRIVRVGADRQLASRFSAPRRGAGVRQKSGE